MSTTTTLPAWGLVRIERLEERSPLVACLGHNDHEALDDLTAADLRRLAGDALTAADWLERSPHVDS